MSPEELADLRSQETILTLLAKGDIPTDIAAAEDFSDPLLQNLYTGLVAGRSPAVLAEEQPTDAARARVTAILFANVAEDRNDRLIMAKDCLSGIRRRKQQR